MCLAALLLYVSKFYQFAKVFMETIFSDVFFSVHSAAVFLKF